MDVNVDQGIPRGDLARFENGKYLYRLDNGKFDIDKFNRDFDQYKVKRKNEMNEKIQQKLDELNKPPEEIPAYNLSVGQIMINIKDTLFGIIDDLLRFDFTWNVVLKKNRLFYLGLAVIIIASIIYLYYFFKVNSINDPLPTIITHVHEIKLSNEPVIQNQQNVIPNI
ncbi:hypothetical protein QKU48_gp0328 [Fadolivirus algeromassiliense]|jgi:hypothetical protein|uniref:Uncharacterized protein n=1 Tax=Fadolivirus FV1/VV64 TaxID=3070911 RepID=A0A7D3QVF5_9VIRU|nr:hypothetical protein QKU48_gp0328 [Fadolivirus algeromassiliense]QKF93786.1 hypothetical protein Fadolivirus_1_328 [Fadolivirus FV1/VV64]